MTDREIIDRLRMERHRQRLKQSDVSKKTRKNGVLHLQPSNLSMYEREKSMPGIDKVCIWAEALNMTLKLEPKKRTEKDGETAQG